MKTHKTVSPRAIAATAMMGAASAVLMLLSFPMPFARVREDVAEDALPLVGLDPTLPLNHPTPDGYLHTWAPIPTDMEQAITALIPSKDLPALVPTVSALTALDLTEP